MKGTIPLDNDEIRRVSTCFTDTFQIRNRGLFMLGVRVFDVYGISTANLILTGLTQNDQISPIFTGFGAVRNRTYRRRA